MVRSIPPAILFSFPPPNYVDPVTRGPELIIINGIFIGLVTVTVFARLYSRIFIKRWFGSDDIFIMLAFITTVGLTINVILANTMFYWDRHIWDIPRGSVEGILQVAFTAKLIFVFASTFTRQSLLCFYYRLVQDSGVKWFIWAIHCTVVFNIAICILFTALGIWQCTPIRAYWAIPTPVGGHCVDEGPVTISIGAINCFTNLLVTLLPIPVILRLQMPLRRRIGVIFVFCLGFVVIIAGVVRTYYVWKGLMDSYDETWFAYPLWIAAAVEIDLGVICACAPALRPLMSRSLCPMLNSISSSIRDFINRSCPGIKMNASERHRNDSSRSSSSTLHSKKALSKLGSKTGSKSSSKEPDPETDPDNLSFITYPDGINPHPHRGDSASKSCGLSLSSIELTPTTSGGPRDWRLPSVPLAPLSGFNQTAPLPLEIVRRQSIELVHLDRRTAVAHDFEFGVEAGGCLDPNERLELGSRVLTGSPVGSRKVVGADNRGKEDMMEEFARRWV